MGKKNIAFVNKDMLIWARGETIFKTPEDLENRFPQFSAEKIKAWESGEDLPSVTEAKELAAKYKLPFACFFMPKCPEKKPKKSYVDRRTFWGSDYSMMSYELWSEIERIKSDRDILLSYWDGEENYDSLPIVTNIDDIKTIGLGIKQYLNIPLSFNKKKEYGGNPFNYFRKKLEEKGIIVAQLSGVELFEMKGLSIYEDNFPIVAVNNRDYERSKVFSLFHEVAHLIRRSSSLCLINDDQRNDAEEKLCDSIAAEILMPTNEFLNVVKGIAKTRENINSYVLQAIADKFGVSTVAVFRRLYDLGEIDKDFYVSRLKEINNDFQKVVDKVKEKLKASNAPIYPHIKFINSHGHLMPQAVLQAHYNGRLSFGEMCTVLNIKSCHIEKLARAVML